MVDEQVTATDARRQNIKLIAILIATLAIVGLLWIQWFLNGSRFHPWTWHRAPVWPFVALMAASAIPFAIAQALEARLRIRSIAIGLLMLSLLGMQIVSAMAQDHELSLMPIARIVQSKLSTSYFTDAAALIDVGVSPTELLATYPQRLDSFFLHSRSKPPGPMLYWYFWIHVLGPSSAAAIAGGLVIGLLATISVPATYWLVKTLTNDQDAAFAGASYLSLTPATVVFLPQFDQIYPAVACALLGTWVFALQTGKLRWTIAFGVTLIAITFTTYALLVLGVFIIGYSILSRPGWRRFILACTVSLAIVASFYVLLWFATRFDPIRTFRTVLEHQSAMKAELKRPWLATVPADFVDLLLGMGWLGALIVAGYLMDRLLADRANRTHLTVVLLCLAQPIVVALTGLLPGESSRVWMFMLPLLMVPIGLEISCWHPPHRWMVYFCLWILVTMTGQNLRFH